MLLDWLLVALLLASACCPSSMHPPYLHPAHAASEPPLHILYENHCKALASKHVPSIVLHYHEDRLLWALRRVTEPTKVCLQKDIPLTSETHQSYISMIEAKQARLEVIHPQAENSDIIHLIAEKIQTLHTQKNLETAAVERLVKELSWTSILRIRMALGDQVAIKVIDIYRNMKRKESPGGARASQVDQPKTDDRDDRQGLTRETQQKRRSRVAQPSRKTRQEQRDTRRRTPALKPYNQLRDLNFELEGGFIDDPLLGLTALPLLDFNEDAPTGRGSYGGASGYSP